MCGGGGGGGNGYRTKYTEIAGRQNDRDISRAPAGNTGGGTDIRVSTESEGKGSDFYLFLFFYTCACGNICAVSVSPSIVTKLFVH